MNLFNYQRSQPKLALHKRVRNFLIQLLAGRMPVLMNVQVTVVYDMPADPTTKVRFHDMQDGLFMNGIFFVPHGQVVNVTDYRNVQQDV